MPSRTPSPPNSGIHRAILALMGANVVVGAVLVLLGTEIWHSKAISQLGLALVVIGGGLYFFFRWLGRREARRRSDLGPPEPPA